MLYDTRENGASRHKPTKRRWALTLVGLLSGALTILSLPIQADAQGKSATRESYELHSNAPFHEVHVPFELRQGNIYVTADLAGKSVECMLDTGCAGVRWSDQLGVVSTPTRWRTEDKDASGHVITSTVVQLPYLQLGDYRTENLTGSVVNTKNDASLQFDRYAVIGPAAFQNVVLTIDYQKHELVLRDPTYDFTRQSDSAKNSENATALKFRMVASTQHNYGIPSVAGHLNGKPVRLLLDTGWAGTVSGLAEDCVDKNIDLHTKATSLVTAPFIFGDDLIVRIESVPLSLDADLPIEINRDAYDVPRLSRDLDGAIGYDILSQFRVTFDFPRKRILLEPYSPDFRKVLAENPPWTRITVGDKEFRIPPKSEIAYAKRNKIQINGSMKGIDISHQIALKDITFYLAPGCAVGYGVGGAITLTHPDYPTVTIVPDLSEGSKR